MTTPPLPPSTSIPTLLKELRNETTTLFQQEVALAKAELKEKSAKAAHHAGQLALGGGIVQIGAIVLLIGLGHLLGVVLIRFGLAPDVATWLAPGLVGLVVALIGWSMLARARKALAHDDLLPRQTIASLRESKVWAQHKLHPSP